ncbi:MAG: response regulator [Candidatus Niyogibacteria bacterium]|nr:response regulator [Candidatus Niyogibacteria bacterium]
MTRILIIEDDVFIAGLITQRLKNDFQIDLAIAAEDAFKKIEERVPDLILLDLILPGVDGFEILKKLKSDDATKAIPVIILSNLGNRDEVEKGIAMGAVNYLIKSNIMPDDVVKTIKETLKS